MKRQRWMADHPTYHSRHCLEGMFLHLLSQPHLAFKRRGTSPFRSDSRTGMGQRWGRVTEVCTKSPCSFLWYRFPFINKSADQAWNLFIFSPVKGSRTLALKSRSMRYQQPPQGTCRNADSHSSLPCYRLRVCILRGSQVTPCTLKFKKYHCPRKSLLRCQTTSYKRAWQPGLYIRITGRTLNILILQSASQTIYINTF